MASISCTPTWRNLVLHLQVHGHQWRPSDGRSSEGFQGPLPKCLTLSDSAHPLPCLPRSLCRHELPHKRAGQVSPQGTFLPLERPANVHPGKPQGSEAGADLTRVTEQRTHGLRGQCPLLRGNTSQSGLNDSSLSSSASNKDRRRPPFEGGLVQKNLAHRLFNGWVD